MAGNRTGHARFGVDRPDLGSEVPKVVPPFQIVHSISSRIRIHIPDWGNVERTALEHRLRVVPGVCAVLADPLTRHVLIRFDPPRGARERVLTLIETVLRKCGQSA